LRHHDRATPGNTLLCSEIVVHNSEVLNHGSSFPAKRGDDASAEDKGRQRLGTMIQLRRRIPSRQYFEILEVWRGFATAVQNNGAKLWLAGVCKGDAAYQPCIDGLAHSLRNR
jgi:hypothetical protein